MDWMTLGLFGAGFALGIGLAVSYIREWLERKLRAKEADYKLLVLLDPAGNIVTIIDAKLTKQWIEGLKVVPEDGSVRLEEVSLTWADDSHHPADYVITKDGDIGYMLAAVKDGVVSPIVSQEKVQEVLRDLDLIEEMKENIIKLQSFKLDAYDKFFEEYKAIRDALFGTDIVKHVRAVGALCAKMPNLLDTFAEGYIVAKLEIASEDEIMQKEELKEWLENPQTVLTALAELVAEKLYEKISSGGKGGESE